MLNKEYSDFLIFKIEKQYKKLFFFSGLFAFGIFGILILFFEKIILK